MSVVRQFPEQDLSIGEMSRDDRVARYADAMRPQIDAGIMAARSEIVRKWRAKTGGYDTPDTSLHRWYKAEDWTDEGVFVGPEAPASTAMDHAARLAKARAVLAAAEAKAGVKPVQAPNNVTGTASPAPNNVTNNVTGQNNVTETVPNNVTACPACGTAFQPANRRQAYCSTACRMAAHRRKESQL